MNVARELVNGASSADLLTGGVDELFMRTPDGETRTFLTDRLGSTIALLDDSGQVRTSYAYGPTFAVAAVWRRSSEYFRR